MKPELIIISCIFLIFVALEIVKTGFFKKRGQTSDDATVEVVGSLLLVLFTQPLVLFCGAAMAEVIAPSLKGVLLDWHFAAVFGLFLLLDDLTQYWWHRLAHTVPSLYKLHRPHHNAEYLSIRVVYRNNFFYYLFMPGLWFSGALIYMGGGWVYSVYLVIKMSVIYGAHSDVRWDDPLYKIRWLSPLMWLIERTISTPATHSAHHGKHADDGVTNYKGNFGNLLFFWDVLFGTALITRRYPEKIGAENLPYSDAAEQLFWPLVRTNNQRNSKAHD